MRGLQDLIEKEMIFPSRQAFYSDGTSGVWLAATAVLHIYLLFDNKESHHWHFGQNNKVGKRNDKIYKAKWTNYNNKQQKTEAILLSYLSKLIQNRFHKVCKPWCQTWCQPWPPQNQINWAHFAWNKSYANFPRKP